MALSKRKILVVGAGPAGCASAIFLRQQGFKVLLIDRADRQAKSGIPPIGESLSPDAATLLKQLGIWEDFCAGPHLKCFGNLSYWHSDQPQHHDFMQHPIGHGWHLDRAAFDAQILAKAKELGTIFYPKTSVAQLEFADDTWQVKLSTETDSSEIQADFIIDATGRNSWVARQQGISRLYESEQLALIAFLNISSDFEDSRTLVETTDDGWWYSAAIPGQRMATAFFFHPSHPSRSQWLHENGWHGLLQNAKNTASRVKTANGQLFTTPRLFDAHSSILERLHGLGWVAVGDAALTYDPIAAHGITMGLASARDATQAIALHFQSDTEALNRYEAVLWAAFQRYAEERERFSLL